MHSLISPTIGLVLLLSLTSEAAPVNLAALCSGASNQGELRTVVELKGLLDSIEQTGTECPPRVIEAIKDLAAIAEDKQACSMSKAVAITGFVDKYLKQTPGDIPKPLADFAVAYGMQVSRICSHEMVERFSAHADTRLYERLGPQSYAKFQAFKRYLVDESPVGLILSPILRTGELVLPVDLMQLVPEMNADKLDVTLPRDERLISLKSTCENLLQPLYESTLLPLAHLNRAGFSNIAFYWKKVHKDNGRFWSAAVYLCESLRAVRFKLQAESTVQVGDISCEASLTEQLDQDAANECTQEPAASRAPIRGYASEQQVQDEVLSNSVGWLVRNYNAHQSEVARLREKIQKRGFDMLVAMFKLGKYKELARELLRLIKVSGGAEADDFEKSRSIMVGLMESSNVSPCPPRALQADENDADNSHERKGLVWWGWILLIIASILLGVCGGNNNSTTVFLVPLGPM